MPSYEFTVQLDRMPSDDDYDLLFDAGLDDATVTTREGRGFLDVNRVAASLSAAIVSVATDAEAAGFAVVSIEEDDLASLKTIAQRVDRTYESLRLLSTGKRGPGNFPPPVSGDGWSLYSWASVASWFATHYDSAPNASDDDRVLAAADLMVRARALVSAETLTALAALAHRPAALGESVA